MASRGLRGGLGTPVSALRESSSASTIIVSSVVSHTVLDQSRDGILTYRQGLWTGTNVYDWGMLLDSLAEDGHGPNFWEELFSQRTAFLPTGNTQKMMTSRT